jgi:ATP-dependent DNA helicase RecQ
MNYNTIDLQANFNKKSTIYFKATSKQVLNYPQKNSHFTNFIKILLRTYSGVFEQETQIDEFLLAKKAGTTSYKVIAFLNLLEQDGILTYQKLNSDASITFLLPREDDKTINSVSKNMELYLNQKREKAKQLVAFIKNDSICRSIQILHYFDEKQTKKCGICDVCLSKKTKPVSLEKEVLSLLKNKESYSSKEIIEQLSYNEKDILLTLRMLLSEEKISINNQQKFQIK